jgi:nitroreductase
MDETFHSLVKRSRSVRRYQEDKDIPKSVLLELVDSARTVPSAGNRQPNRFIIVNDKNLNKGIFNSLRWLGYLSEDMGPKVGERPNAYIIMLHDTTIKNASIAFDAGIAAQTIVLGANYRGLGCCIIGSVDSSKISALLNIPPRYDGMMVIALGYPVEEVVIEESKDSTDVKYWRDENKVHHVPKLPLERVLIGVYSDE